MPTYALRILLPLFFLLGLLFVPVTEFIASASTSTSTSSWFVLLAISLLLTLQFCRRYQPALPSPNTFSHFKDVIGLKQTAVAELRDEQALYFASVREDQAPPLSSLVRKPKSRRHRIKIDQEATFVGSIEVFRDIRDQDTRAAPRSVDVLATAKRQSSCLLLLSHAPLQFAFMSPEHLTPLTTPRSSHLRLLRAHSPFLSTVSYASVNLNIFRRPFIYPIPRCLSSSASTFTSTSSFSPLSLRSYFRARFDLHNKDCRRAWCGTPTDDQVDSSILGPVSTPLTIRLLPPRFAASTIGMLVDVSLQLRCSPVPRYLPPPTSACASTSSHLFASPPFSML